MLHPRQGRDREHGQVIVVAAVAMIVILVFAAIVVDLGVLRNNRQILVNTLDSAALAGGTLLPVDGSQAGAATAVNNLIVRTINANYPGGLPSSAYTISYRCLIGVDTSSPPGPYISRDVPAVCDPTHSLGRPAVASDFTGAGPTRNSACAPSLGDKCNVVMINGSATTPFSFGPITALLPGGHPITSGSTGAVVSVSCGGLCGASPVLPVDLVIILDRTGSMQNGTGSQANSDCTSNPCDDTGAKIQALQAAADAVLQVYDPAKQRVALGLIGPSTAIDGVSQPGLCPFPMSPTSAPHPWPAVTGNVYGVANNSNWTYTTTLSASVTAAATTIKVNPVPVAGTSVDGFPTSGNYYIMVGSEEMQVIGGQGTLTWTVTRHTDGTTAAAHASGVTVFNSAGVTPGPNSAGMWIPVGLSGTDTAIPNPYPNGTAGTYEVGGVLNKSSQIVQAISCIGATSNATNLAGGIAMAQWYLDTWGRPGVTEGIILETDGHPECGFEGCQTGQVYTNAQFTCGAAYDAATAAKLDKTHDPKGIQIYTVGYGVTAAAKCPQKLTNPTATQLKNLDTSKYNQAEQDAWAGQSATTFLQGVATDANHYFENASPATIGSAFVAAAQNLAKGSSHLVQLYPPPVVTGASGATSSVAISGKNFTGAFSVTFGAATVGFTLNSDTSITAAAPPGTSGSTVDVIVTTPGGTSTVTPADLYTYP
jgi:hypothetical protein